MYLPVWPITKMTLPLHIAKKLQQLLLPGHSIASSGMQHTTVLKMLEDGLLQKKQLGNTKALLFIPAKENVAAYLKNHFGINHLHEYITTLEREEQSRALNILASGNSKLQAVRTFPGFLINCYEAIPATLHKKPIHIQPIAGSCIFMHEYHHFVPHPSISIVGIENPENFLQIEKQRYLFTHIRPLFVCRYPQSQDVIKWLSTIPNQYLHFGDLDFAGLQIFETEYKKHLGNRASFFVPENTEALLKQYGNRQLFNKQYNPAGNQATHSDIKIQAFINLLFKYKKVLEQEVFIKQPIQ